MNTILLLFGVLFMGQISSANQDIVFKGHAHFKIKPNHIEDFKSEVQKIIGPTLKEEGCISYEAYQIFNEKGQATNEFVFHEIWKSKKAMMIDHKEKSPHMKAFFQKIKVGDPDSYVESFDVSGFEVKSLNKRGRL